MRKPWEYVVVASLAMMVGGCGTKDDPVGGSCLYTAQPPATWQAPTCLDFTDDYIPVPAMGPVACQTLLGKGASPWTQAGCSEEDQLGFCRIDSGVLQETRILVYKSAVPPSVEMQAAIAAAACPVLGARMFQASATWVPF